MRYFLVGFMGSGKSFWGKKWGEAFGIPFIDLDEEIERAAGESVQSIFHKRGEKAFRQLEHKTLFRLFSTDNYILSCGGGTPCYFDNMKAMNKNGITIYLKASPEILAARLIKEKETRPLIKDIADDRLILYIEQKLAERRRYYSQAVYHFDTEFLSEENFERIIRRHGE